MRLPKPRTHSSDLARLPRALLPLTKEKRWVIWSWELRKNKHGGEDWTKPPRQPRNLQFAQSNMSDSWGSYEQALRRWEEGDADGIGFMLWHSHIGAADLDHCCQRDAKKRKTTIDEWACAVQEQANGAYREVTVSGTGLRVIGTTRGADLQRAFNLGNGARIELFRNTARYITVSGLQLGECSRLPPIDDFLDILRARYDGDGRAPSRQDRQARSDTDYEELIRNGAPEGQRSEAFQAVVWHSANKGWSIERISDELARHPHGIAHKYVDRLHKEVARSYDKWQRQNPAGRQGLPTIRTAEGGIARTVDEAQSALLDAKVPIVVRGRMLVEPVTVERPAAHDRTTVVTVFVPLGESKLAYLLNKHAAVFQRYDLKRKQWVTIDPPHKITAALLALRSWQFPEVVGIVSAPTMRRDGSILSKPGYDPQTRLWCNSNVELPQIPERPSRAQAEQALQLLKDLLSSFPFVNEVDRAVAIAAILSAVLRGAFDVVPLIAILAHEAGSGKSYLVDLIANIITGRICPVITGSKSAEEMEKRLGSLLLEGSSMTSLDNLSHDIEGDLLAQIVTQPVIKTRILGKSQIPECEWAGMLFATGNNIRVVGDMVRRTLVCQLDPKVERPELRTFKFSPIERVLRERGAYIAAAIIITRAYMAAGRPEAGKVRPLAGFDEWSKMVREPLIWLGEQDPVKSMEATRAADPDRAAAQELVMRWRKCIGINKPVSASAIIKIANQQNHAHEYRSPNFRALLLEHAGSSRGDQIDPIRLGKWLQKENGRVHSTGRGTLRITLVPHRGRSNEYVLGEVSTQDDDS
jgi:putative DNA primase/helicase